MAELFEWFFGFTAARAAFVFGDAPPFIKIIMLLPIGAIAGLLYFGLWEWWREAKRGYGN